MFHFPKPCLLGHVAGEAGFPWPESWELVSAIVLCFPGVSAKWPLAA